MSIHSKSIRLQSGGNLTVTLDADPFALNKSDREFIASIADQLHDYEVTIAVNWQAVVEWSGEREH